MTSALDGRIAAGLSREVADEVRAFASCLAVSQDAQAVLFYGSNLRTASLDGVLDFYVLGGGAPEKGLWPRVSYHEWVTGGTVLRAKVATMTLRKFAEAASGQLLDTTIWARFVQPSVLIWARDEAAREMAIGALAEAARTAARVAAVVGPEAGAEAEYWTALFQATYRAEFRVEKGGRERSILEANKSHFDGLLPLAWESAGLAFTRDGTALRPILPERERRRLQRRWTLRRRIGKPLNLLRLIRASFTFDGAARYAAWKVERHTGVQMRVTPWRERHPLLAAPVMLWPLWRHRRAARRR